jgi:glycosyltransferase involved in cell wall biosynthesis
MPDQMFITHFFPRIRREEGGVVQVILDLCQSLARQGHCVRLATCDPTDVPEAWRQSGHNPGLHLLQRSSVISARLSQRGVRQFIESLANTNVVHFHTPWELSNLQLARATYKAGVPYAITVHGMLDDYCMRQKGFKKQVFLKLGGRRVFANATTVHFTAEAEREQAQRWIPGDYLPVVQACALDLTLYDTLPGPGPALRAFPQLANTRRKVLFLSRVHPKKGLELLIEATALLKNQGLEFDLAIAGPGDDGYVTQLRQLADLRGLQQATHFLGMVRGEIKLSLYELADVFVLPTYQENFGLVLPEALACGTPVITTRGTDIWRELTDAGAYIVDQNPEAIAQAIARILSDDQLRSDLGTRGREYVKNWLAEDKVSAGYERMYRDTIEHARAIVTP